MNNIENLIRNNFLLVDGRTLENDDVRACLENLYIQSKKLLRVGVLVPLKTNNDYKIISNEVIKKDLEFTFIYAKVNYDSLNENNLKVVFKQKDDDILFITNCQKLAFEVFNLSDNENKIIVRRVNENALLEPFPMISDVKITDTNLYSYIQFRSPRIDYIPLDCDRPKEYGKVYINNTPCFLKEQIGSGGEGIVYAIDDEIVAKIFSKERLTKTRSEKISMMVNRRINDYSICWPIDEVRNELNDIVGYTMKRCVGKPISTLYRGPIITQQLYPDYTVSSAVEIAIKILTKIKKLHENNVLLGDINDRNFIIDNLDEVFLIDTDSYQLEDYSCDVGTVGYISPELKEGVLSATLRTFEDESYGVAVFIFRTLMLGHFPYAQIGQDEDYVKLIKKHQFPYSMNSKKTLKKVPLSAFDCWNKLSSLLMRMFINTFAVTKNSRGNKRHTVEEWIFALEAHLASIERKS